MSSVSAIRERIDEKKFYRKLPMNQDSENENDFYANEDIEEQSFGRKERKKGRKEGKEGRKKGRKKEGSKGERKEGKREKLNHEEVE